MLINCRLLINYTKEHIKDQRSKIKDQTSMADANAHKNTVPISSEMICAYRLIVGYRNLKIQGYVIALKRTSQVRTRVRKEIGKVHD
uniref:Uncharacterized protein n=1 Tax=Pristionchus pacificus TaxID=54126 RepID=A0A2A6C6I8_PRIPA|eukprot:PDM73727.1 hypothetical protein PRIPAC_41083 [Pristionchus pacificus]